MLKKSKIYLKYKLKHDSSGWPIIWPIISSDIKQIMVIAIVIFKTALNIK